MKKRTGKGGGAYRGGYKEKLKNAIARQTRVVRGGGLGTFEGWDESQEKRGVFGEQNFARKRLRKRVIARDHEKNGKAKR